MTQESNYTTGSDARNLFVASQATARDLVGDALSELEARGIRWSEILDVLANVAQLRGQHELAQVLASAGHEVAKVEPNSSPQ